MNTLLHQLRKTNAEIDSVINFDSKAMKVVGIKEAKMKVKKAMHFTLEVQIKLMDLESITTATLDEGINHMSDVVDINNSCYASLSHFC